jgi:hypothetical protein
VLVVTVIGTLLTARRFWRQVKRLVAVLGYSAWRGNGLHPICAARLTAAERPAEEADAVLLSGWSRHRHRPSEAELMKAAWRGPAVRLIADGDAAHDRRQRAFGRGRGAGDRRRRGRDRHLLVARAPRPAARPGLRSARTCASSSRRPAVRARRT